MTFDEQLSALMQKLSHTEKCITDIQKAIFVKGVYINDLTPLSEYAAKIMLIVDGELESSKTILVEFTDVFDGLRDDITIYGVLEKPKQSEVGIEDNTLLLLPDVRKKEFIDKVSLSDSLSICSPEAVALKSALGIKDTTKLLLPNVYKLCVLDIVTISDKVLAEVLPK